MLAAHLIAGVSFCAQIFCATAAAITLQAPVEIKFWIKCVTSYGLLFCFGHESFWHWDRQCMKQGVTMPGT